MYQSLSDADVTATTAFLTGPNEPLADRQRYDGRHRPGRRRPGHAEGRCARPGRTSSCSTSLAAISAGLPVYTGYVPQAQTYTRWGTC